MHMVLKENPDYTLILKLLILSPMIIAWTASLICIAVMCGVCYPFGLSESSTKSKSKDKKGRKSTDEKKGKKKSGNDE
uniref:Uncharacterized protein n=1 Tax=Panagrolaimus sp. ES5 TaxID=591445 RepID=A0AC34G014_9BILA